MRKQALTLLGLAFSVLTFGQNWQPLGGGTTNEVRGCFVDTVANDLFISGRFSHAGGVEVNQIARWDGSMYSPIGIGTGDTLCQWGCGSVNRILKYHDTIFVSGAFQMMAGDWNNKYSAFFDGNDWYNFGGADSPMGMQLLGDSFFCFPVVDTVFGEFIPAIGIWNGTDLDIPFQLPPTNNVYFLDIKYYQGDILLSGNFSFPTINAKEIVRWDGSNLFGLNGGPLGDTWINDIEVYKGLLWVAGYFYEVDGNVADFVMAWDGQQWIDPFPGILFTEQARDLEVIDGELYIAGPHLAYADTGHYGIARYDGQYLRSFGGSLFFPRQVFGFNNEVIVTYPYSTFEGDSINYIAKWAGGDSVDYTYYAALDIPETETNEVKIYPNPAQSSIHVQFSSPLTTQLPLQIYDLQGRLIREETFQSGQSQHQLAVEKLSPGLYLLAIGQFVERIVVK